MLVLPKVYTRDFPIVLCQIWGSRYAAMLGEKVPVFPGYVYVFNDSLVRAYRNPSLIPEANLIFKKKVSSNPKFLTELSTKTLTDVSRLRSYIPEKMDTKLFLQFLNEVRDFWEGMFVSMYVPSDERFSSADKNVAFQLRTKIDMVEYELFGVIDKSLGRLFPNLGILARYLTKEEIEFNRVPSFSVLKKRQHSVLYVVGERMLSEKAFTSLKKEYSFELEPEEKIVAVEEFKGNIACSGSVKGTVKVVLHTSDISKVMNGDVLVSSMTIPDYLPAMKKAVAFVTDEGGITCHAAIVAREMKKPCIIGTKIATQVLKDGDMVEVDAEKGVVRILK